MPEMHERDKVFSVTPKHIAVVMDGNGRWAKKRFLPRTAGHKAGVKATRMLVENCTQHNIKALTIFAFSSENWNRPEKEVSGLMSLFVATLGSEMKKLHKQNVRVRFIGDCSRFSKKLQDGIANAEKMTESNTGLNLSIAANYGGRWDIVNTCKKIVRRVLSGEISEDDITESMFADEIDIAGLPDPDLLIRTGGESRMSNFLIWHLAYTELYFSDVLWPDFNAKELEKSLEWFSTRQRRFGKTSRQIQNSERKTG
jgi:undecaprenyl diphosphate synthase